MKITITMLFVLVLVLTGYGQQESQYTQYMYSMNVLNPAYVGSKPFSSMNIFSRVQWVGVEDAPQTFLATLDTPIGNKNFGAGGVLFYDQLGPRTETSLFADVSYRVRLSEEGELALGLKGRFTSVFLDGGSLLEPGDPLELGKETLFNGGIGAGLLYIHEDTFYVGFSTSSLKATNSSKKTNASALSDDRKPHYFLMGGYVKDYDSFKFKPSALIKAVLGAPISLDLSTNFLFNDRVELGLSYRIKNSVSVMANAYVKKGFRVGYSYDQTTNNVFGGFSSHEFSIMYDFNMRRNIKSPRFF